MSQKQLILKDCDRCAKQNLAEETIRFAYDGNTYEIDVCRQHADMLDRDMRGWTRLAREIDNPISAFSLSSSQREFLRRPSGRMPAKPAPAPEPEPEPEPALDINLWPTESAIEAMERIGAPWPKVVEAVRNNIAVVPSDRDDVSTYIARDLKVLVTEDYHVIGVLARDPGEALPVTTPSEPKKIVRKGKRGGIGNVGPRTHEELLEAIRRSPGWSLEYGGKHWKVLGPDGQVSTLPVTPSDWRGTLNAVAQLRALGLNLRETARQSA